LESQHPPGQVAAEQESVGFEHAPPFFRPSGRHCELGDSGSHAAHAAPFDPHADSATPDRHTPLWQHPTQFAALHPATG
jgi:hypothetical protein